MKSKEKMSRHRNVRSMNYSEEYEGFDDVYGHSVEDDHCISPSEARFLYDRTRHPQMSAFINEENDIAEEDELGTVNIPEPKEFNKFKPNRVDEEKLRLCIDDIQDVIGDMVPLGTIQEIVLKCDYDVQKSLDHILNEKETENNVLLEEPASKIENQMKNKNRGGGDGPGNPVRKFVIPKLRNVQVEHLEKGIKDVTIKGDAFNSFSSLKSLMEHHQKSATSEDEEKESCDGNSPSTLAEFSRSFLNKKKSSNIPSLPTDHTKQCFVIPKLQKKVENISENKWLIDLSSALKSNSELIESQSSCDPSSGDLEALNISQASQDIFLEPDFDASHTLNADLEVKSENSSPFAKILCRKWECKNVNVVERENLLVSKVVRFDFSTPSPDDIILKYIRRK